MSKSTRKPSKTETPYQTSVIRRMRRIEGQAKGVGRMIEEDRYCIDILIQIKAIRAALKKVESEILSNHADHCIHEAVQSGSKRQQSEKFGELIELLTKYR